MDKYIELEAATAIIEEKQKELCPVGRYGRGYVYGSDREKYDAWDEIVDALENIPAADVAPVVHGRWIRPHWRNSNYCCDCSECGGEAMHRDYQWNKNGIYPICPNCGAKMDIEDGGADNEAD